MQIIKEKPQNLVSIAYVKAIRQEIEQKDRYTTVKIHNLLNEFEKSGLNLLQAAETNSLDLNLELTETDLQFVTDWATEPCFCPLVPEAWN